MAVTYTDTQPSLNVTVAARIRAALALRGMTQADLARAMSVPTAWLSRRVSPHAARPVSLNLDEIENIAAILSMPVPVLFGIGEDHPGRQVDTSRYLPAARRHLHLVEVAA